MATTTDNKEDNINLPWWVRGSPKECAECGKAISEPLECRKCNRFRYCDKDCRTKHWQQGHEKECPVHVYIRKDEEILSRIFGQDDFVDLMNLIQVSSEAQKIRVEGNTLFAKKDYAGALNKYNLVIAQLKALRDQVVQKRDQKSTSLGAWLGANLARVYSNACVCHLELNVHSLEKLWRTVPGIPEDLRAEMLAGISPNLPLHDSGVIAIDIRARGLEGAKEVRLKALRPAGDAAADAIAGAPSWWKGFYRLAQVNLLVIEPMDAMHKLDMAEHCALKETDFFYDKDKELKAALNTICSLREHVEQILLMTNETYSKKQKARDGTIASIHDYFSSNYTRLGSDHPRIPFAQMKPEMLAVRLCAAIEGSPDTSHPSTEYLLEGKRSEAASLLNKILTLMAGPPLELFPADGSQDRVPMISINLLAFYLRAAMSQDMLVKMNVESIVRGATEWMTDEDAYCIATHNFYEVEHAHSPLRGHSKSFSQTGGGGCMPCSYRLLRAGCSDWGPGLQSAAHQGKVGGICFFLNRLLCGVEGGPTVLEAILEQDEMGCNTMMHAANDTFSGLSGLSIRLLAHAATFDSRGEDTKVSLRSARRVLNSADRNGYTPAMAAVTLKNESALAALVGLRAKLYDNKTGKMSRMHQQMANALLKEQINDRNTDERFRNLLRSISASTNDHASCSYCGRPPKTKKDRLFFCARCKRARYCNGTCQKADHKRHKFICTAKVEKDVAWYGQNIDSPRP